VLCEGQRQKKKKKGDGSDAEAVLGLHQILVLGGKADKQCVCNKFRINSGVVFSS